MLPNEYFLKREANMTLNELFDSPNELNWSRLDMYEVFNSTTPINWYEEDKQLNGKFQIDNLIYIIELQPSTFQKYSFINVAFCILDNNNKKQYELSLDTKNPARVLGAIINGVTEKIKEFEYDALVFSASNNVEKRMSFYNKLANIFKKHFATIITNIKTNTGLFTILIANTVPKNEVDEFVIYVSNSMKVK